MLATGGTTLPDPRSGSKDWAKAGSAMTLAKVARIRTFFIAVSVLFAQEPAFALSPPSIAIFVSSCFQPTDVAPTHAPVISFRNIRLIA
jgi:hypothetical protein